MIKLNYEKINKQNIDLAAKIQLEIFPNSSSYIKYLEEIDCNKSLPIDFLVYYYEKPIGVIGLYELNNDKDSVWLGCFGLLKEYRKKGYGKQMLNYIINIAKEYNRKYLRLYTYEIWNEVAQNFYKKHMHYEEYYTNKDDDYYDIKYGKPKIFTYSLFGDNIKPWNNKYIGLKEDDNDHNLSIKKMTEKGII